jgi:hypothetical protein
MKLRFSVPCLVISSLAILLSVFTIGRCWYGGPRADRLAKYDFSTPQIALVSQMALELDLFAQIQFQAKVDRPILEEYLQTLEVKKEADFEGKKILFVSFAQNGVKTFKTEEMQKDTQTGIWYRTAFAKITKKNTPFSRIGGPDERTPLEKQIERWENQGEL